MRQTIKPALVLLPLLLSGCQQSKQAETTPMMLDGQAQQIAALIAGTEYLKYQCGRSDLPTNGQIEQAAYAAAHQRGWQPPAGVAARSNMLYQQLLKDSTPQAAQCAEFQQLLQPFLTTLRKT
ncbi:type II secretion system pilot lipoprotein GspS [Cedecea colo]|uniref:Pullulanase n=1 Tax=Cedecea colo TaxID=2552946 RepID=A0ABX0VGN6_9ENTR|nr:type II secretion system pilot lipoprotein GspS [Cedecea colo]NIY46302.1 pullulanase [Cedecea colo]